MEQVKQRREARGDNKEEQWTMHRCNKPVIWRLLLVLGLTCLSLPVTAQDKPNIVLVFLDNFGWGEPGFNGGGVIRGAATPELDRLANEGLRLTNFNVEVQCTPSRSAILTGRYAIRSGNATVPLGEGGYGLVQWEVTLAEMLSKWASVTPVVDAM